LISDRPVTHTSDNTQYSQQTDINDLDGNRTRNPSKRAAADPQAPAATGIGLNKTI